MIKMLKLWSYLNLLQPSGISKLAVLVHHPSDNGLGNSGQADAQSKWQTPAGGLVDYSTVKKYLEEQ